MRILIADDDDMVRMVIREVLRTQGHALEEARDGNEALKKATAAKFDLILLDQHMPGLSGGEVAEFIRKQSPKTRVVILTGSSRREELEKLAGFSMLPKPFAAGELLSLVSAS